LDKEQAELIAMQQEEIEKASKPLYSYSYGKKQSDEDMPSYKPLNSQDSINLGELINEQKNSEA
jgi:hypothetical protein